MSSKFGRLGSAGGAAAAKLKGLLADGAAHVRGIKTLVKEASSRRH